MQPCSFNRIYVGPCIQIVKKIRMIDSEMCKTNICQLPSIIFLPTIINNGCASSNVFKNQIHQSFFCLIWHINKKHVVDIAPFYTSKNPLSFSPCIPMIFSFSKLAFVNLYYFFHTTNFLYILTL
jgi:hypothetical protein